MIQSIHYYSNIPATFYLYRNHPSANLFSALQGLCIVTLLAFKAIIDSIVVGVDYISLNKFIHSKNSTIHFP